MLIGSGSCVTTADCDTDSKRDKMSVINYLSLFGLSSQKELLTLLRSGEVTFNCLVRRKKRAELFCILILGEKNDF